MKIVVLSDTHIPFGADDIPEELYKVIKKSDLLIHAGDFVDVNFLRKLQKSIKVEAVHGNMDCYEIKNELPQYKVITVKGFTIGIMHGEGMKDNITKMAATAFKNKKLDLIVFGHTHEALKFEHNGVIFLNPGSATDKIFALFNSYALLSIEDSIRIDIVKI